MSLTYETELQKYVYEALRADSALQALIGGGSPDKRVYLAWGRQEPVKVVSGKSAIYVEVFDRPQAFIHGNSTLYMERICLRVFTLLEERGLRDAIVKRLRELFDDMSFETTSYNGHLKEGRPDDSHPTEGVTMTRYFINAEYF